ncbi:MAG: hypothetical protein ABIL58_10610 [Pseudomonadota bacterium]
MNQFKIYRIKDFIRKNASGTLDLERSKALAQELALVASIHRGHNLLIDLRDTTAASGGLMQLMEVVMAFTRALPEFPGKIANIIPPGPERENSARMVESLMQMENFDYRYFTDYEAATGWLADIATFGDGE